MSNWDSLHCRPNEMNSELNRCESTVKGTMVWALPGAPLMEAVGSCSDNNEMAARRDGVMVDCQSPQVGVKDGTEISKGSIAVEQIITANDSSPQGAVQYHQPRSQQQLHRIGFQRKELVPDESILTVRSHFKGQVYHLPENCGRPQTSQGRTFPLKVRSDDMNYDSSDYNESALEKDNYRITSNPSMRFKSLGHTMAMDQAPAVIRTATKIVRKVIVPAQKLMSADAMSSKPCSLLHTSDPTLTLSEVSSSSIIPDPSNTEVVMSKVGRPMKRIFSSGTMSKNGMSWRRRQINEGLEVVDEVPQTVPVQRIPFETQRINRRLRRIKDKLFTETSHECFEFAEHGRCLAGVFCPFDHDGDSTHRTRKICERLMMGLCRGHCGRSHSLSAHQMPICDYFLRLACSSEHCAYLHVKHASDSKCCEDFNRGICKKGDNCLFPHRYYFSVIRRKCDKSEKSNVFQMPVDNSNANTSAGSEEEEEEENDENKKSTLQWML